MKNYLICFLAIVTPLLFGCEKETLSDDASNAFHTLKDLGIKTSNMKFISSGGLILAHLQSSVFKLSKDLIDSIHEEGIVAYTS